MIYINLYDLTIDAETSSAWPFGVLVIPNSFRNLIQKRCWNKFSMTVWFSRHCESISESNTEESLKQVQHDRCFSRHCEFISESNTEKMLKQVQHDCLWLCITFLWLLFLCHSENVENLYERQWIYNFRVIQNLIILFSEWLI